MKNEMFLIKPKVRCVIVPTCIKPGCLLVIRLLQDGCWCGGTPDPVNGPLVGFADAMTLQPKLTEVLTRCDIFCKSNPT